MKKKSRSSGLPRLNGADGDEPKPKLPAWVIWLSVVGFLILNSVIAMFAMQMGGGGN